MTPAELEPLKDFILACARTPQPRPMSDVWRDLRRDVVDRLADFDARRVYDGVEVFLQRINCDRVGRLFQGFAEYCAERMVNLRQSTDLDRGLFAMRIGYAATESPRVMTTLAMLRHSAEVELHLDFFAIATHWANLFGDDYGQFLAAFTKHRCTDIRDYGYQPVHDDGDFRYEPLSAQQAHRHLVRSRMMRKRFMP